LQLIDLLDNRIQLKTEEKVEQLVQEGERSEKEGCFKDNKSKNKRKKMQILRHFKWQPEI
jgi:hypothetical protein